jgi:hypothetical protein
VALAAGDFSGDGRLDVASVNPSSNDITISLGAGDTTLLDSRRFLVGAGPVAVVQGDFNRDGRLDLATANHGSSDVSLLLGLGAGAFQDQQRIVVGANPTALATGDFNADGRLDRPPPTRPPATCPFCSAAATALQASNPWRRAKCPSRW